MRLVERFARRFGGASARADETSGRLRWYDLDERFVRIPSQGRVSAGFVDIESCPDQGVCSAVWSFDEGWGERPRRYIVELRLRSRSGSRAPSPGTTWNGSASPIDLAVVHSSTAAPSTN